MKKFFIILWLNFLLNGCSTFKETISQNDSLTFEVSNYISQHVSEIPIVITNKDLVVKLTNAASAEKIILNFQTDINSLSSIQNMSIKCISQCGIEFVGELNKIQIKNLTLINAHLLTNPNISVENIYIKSSEAIITGLPLNANNAKITIASSQNMLSVQKLLKGINIIPGTGEFVYDTKVIYNQDGKAINSNNNANISDASYNIEELSKTFPNLKWTAPVVSWFGVTRDNYNMDVSNIEIIPGVEHKTTEMSEIWKSGEYDREHAHLISKDLQNRPNYGGTINDNSLVRYIEALNSKNLKVMFYPMILMDIPGKPWRGHIKAKNPDDVHKFFTKKNGYNEFILHYAHLLKGKVNAFVIGSEMQELTQSIDERYSYPDPKHYPAVVELINLAKKIKSILGPDVIITYAANWGEYHHDKNGFHHLDPLWSSQYIDVVGIDAYLPITNKSMGDISIEEIKKGWSSGELWDYYYDRNNKSDIMPEWGLKQIEYWWKNEHWSPKGIKTEWKPKMKPLWFTEFGFPSMHMATNTPNKFWNPEAIDGGIPKKSSGRPDFSIQMRAIRGTLEYWRDKNEIVQNMFLWAWDARPSLYQSNKLDIWSDAELWSRGHWINGKIIPLSQVKILKGFKVNTLETNANELIIEGTSRAEKIIANNIQYIP